MENIFCSNCGKELEQDADFCINCGEKLGDSNTTEGDTENGKNDTHRQIFQFAAVALVICFFILPLASCTATNNLTATGWQIATGTGEMMSMSQDGGNTSAFILLGVSLAVAWGAFKPEKYKELRSYLIYGVVANVTFAVSVLHQSSNRGQPIELTPFFWMQLVAYVGLAVFAHHCADMEKKE
ncbi:MAG: zinc-ribbon domain-containing protein [Defluviitaleaceae bacterium]|nr:zinc-ribbon domain-containing protein [Defluviitaleaceae bacterium]MCL2262265.1 zinc-ribbon domain-containing protein [Defluviitaleaceae bacterium]